MGCGVLRNLCQSDKENQQAAGKEGAIRAVVAVLRKQGTSGGLLSAGCGALHSMCMNA